MKCVARRAGNAQAASWRFRRIRVPGGRYFELVVIGPLDRPAESVPAVTQRGDGIGSTGEDRVMGQVRGRPAAGHGARPAQEVDVAQTAWHRSHVPIQPGDGGHRDRGWLRDLEVSHPFAGSERVRCPALVLPANAPCHREWLPDILANDTYGVVLVTFHAERDGQTVALRSADIWHLAGGKATEHWSFFEDQAAADKLFS
jgi:hypothetical protein